MAEVGDKAALLGAIAAGGTRAKEAYESSLAQLRTSNQDAIRMALSNSIAQSVPTEGQSQLSQTISQPYQNQSANLMAQQGMSGDYFSKMGASAGTYMDQASALVPALEKRYELELANKIAMAGSGGGGSGGGGGGGDEVDPFLALTKSLGGKENTKDYFSGLGDKYQARAFAIEAGVPEGIANSWFTPYSSGAEEYESEMPGAISYGLANKQNIKQFRKNAMIRARELPGNQIQSRKKAVQAYKRIKKRGGKK